MDGDTDPPIVTATYEALAKHIGRPLHVLKLDALLSNVEATTQANIAAVTGALEGDGQLYDLIIGLQHFAHIIEALADDQVAMLFAICAQKSTAGIYALPGVHKRISLAPYAFVRELYVEDCAADEQTLFFASSRLWYFPASLECFNHWTQDSHRYAGFVLDKTRSYFTSERYIAKSYRLTGESAYRNRIDMQREIDFLLRHRTTLPNTPRLIAFGMTEREAWLVRDHIPGMLLMDAIIANVAYDAERVMCDVLNELCALEGAELYHSDLRTWNVILRPDGGASLIDFGAISSTNRDANWPDNIFLAFWIFARSVLERTAPAPLPLMQPLMSPAQFSEIYRSWARAFWAMPVSEWSFTALRTGFMKMRDHEHEALEASGVEVWMAAAESYLATLGDLQRLNTELMVQCKSMQNQQAKILIALARQAGFDLANEANSSKVDAI